MGANIASLVIDGYRIGGYFERIGMEDADLEDKFDHLETALESFEALGDLLVINEEAPSLEQFEPFLEGLGVSLEDIKTIEANNSWDVAAFVKVSARTLKYPTAQTLRRSVPVIRNIGYLINRMAKVAK